MFWVTIAVIIVIALPTITLNLNNYSKNPQSILTGPTTTTTTGAVPNGVSVTKPVQFTLYDALAGGVIASATTFNLYQGQTLLESPSMSASGVATTGSSYTTGTVLNIKMAKSGFETYWVKFTVPAMDPNSAISNANNVVSLYDFATPAYTLTVTGSGGTTFTTGLTVGIAQFAGSTATVSVNAAETTNNAGYGSNYDVINSQWQQSVFEISTAGSSLSITGFPRSTLRGTTTYWQFVCPDGLVGNPFGSGTAPGGFKVATGSNSFGNFDPGCAGSVSQQVIGTTVYGGSINLGFTVAKGSLSGSTQTISIKQYQGYDVSVFPTLGNGGTDASQVGSTFTIIFSN